MIKFENEDTDWDLKDLEERVKENEFLLGEQFEKKCEINHFVEVNKKVGVILKTKEEIESYIQELKEGMERVRTNKHKFRDEEVWKDMIIENQHRISTLYWVLGEMERYD